MTTKNKSSITGEKTKPNAGVGGESDSTQTPFDYRQKDEANGAESEDLIERSDRDTKKNTEVFAEQATSIKGQGERELNFEFQEEFSPILKIQAKGGQELVFDLNDKITLGSDPTKAKIVVEHSSIAPLHCVFGIKDKEVLIKHNAPDGIIIRGKKLEAGKTYKLPYGSKIKLADQLFAEVAPTRPLGLEAVKINRDWKVDLKDDSDDFRGNTENFAQKRALEEKRNASFLKKIFMALFDPRDDQDIEEEYQDDDNEWVTEEQWKNAPAEEKKDKNVKILKEGELIEKNFRSIEKKHIKKAGLLFRPLLSFWMNLKDEFSYFESKSKKDLKKQQEYSKQRLEALKAMHFSQKNLINMDQAKLLAKAGLQSVVEVSNLPPKKLANLLKIKEEEATSLKEELSGAISQGKIVKSDKNITALEKKISANDSKVKTKLKHLQVAGPLKRIFGSLVSYGAIFSLYHYLKLKPELSSVLRDSWTLILTFIPIEIMDRWKTLLDAYELVFHYTLFHIAFQLLSHMLFGTSVGQYLLGLKNGRGIVGARLLGIVRYLIGLILFPFLVFDLPMLLRFKTFKEVLTFNTLIRREARTMFGEFLGVLLTSSIIASATYLIITERPWQQVPKMEMTREQFAQNVIDTLPEKWTPNVKKIFKTIFGISGEVETEKIKIAGMAKPLTGITRYQKVGTQNWRDLIVEKSVKLHLGSLLKVDAGGMVEITIEGHAPFMAIGPLEIETIEGPDHKIFSFNIKSQKFKFKNANKLLARAGHLLLGLQGSGIYSSDVKFEQFVLLNLEQISYAMVLPKWKGDMMLTPPLEELWSGLSSKPAPAGCILQGHFGVNIMTIPVRISPLQFKALAPPQSTYSCQTSIDYEGKIDLPNKHLIAPPGGIVDFENADYIPPEVVGKMDKEFNLYIDKKLDGLIDTQTGLIKNPLTWDEGRGAYVENNIHVAKGAIRQAFDEILKKEKSSKSTLIEGI